MEESFGLRWISNRQGGSYEVFGLYEEVETDVSRGTVVGREGFGLRCTSYVSEGCVQSWARCLAHGTSSWRYRTTMGLCPCALLPALWEDLSFYRFRSGAEGEGGVQDGSILVVKGVQQSLTVCPVSCACIGHHWWGFRGLRHLGV